MNAVQCDWCGKFAPNPVSRQYLIGRYTNKLPEDWYGAGAWRGGATEGFDYDERGEFCSRECISAYFGAPVKDAA